ncbi:MAG: STAS domain-containing protein [Candidatus Aenigmatarchaeota archaeon]
MSKGIEEWVINGVQILEPLDLMDASNIGQLDERLYTLLGRGIRSVILDLSGVKYINSSGLTILTDHWVKFNDNGGHLKVAGLTQKIDKPLVISKLSMIFETYDTVDEAIASFGRNR